MQPMTGWLTDSLLFNGCIPFMLVWRKYPVSPGNIKPCLFSPVTFSISGQNNIRNWLQSLAENNHIESLGWLLVGETMCVLEAVILVT